MKRVAIPRLHVVIRLRAILIDAGILPDHIQTDYTQETCRAVLAINRFVHLSQGGDGAVSVKGLGDKTHIFTNDAEAAKWMRERIAQ